MIKPELLAPAGNEKSAFAAVQSGADSIYIGMKNFGARSYAENFDETALLRVTDYCHERGVLVYVTLNTLIADIEMQEALELARLAANTGVDGFIVQDLGLADIIIRRFPEVPVHISTQATVLNSSAMRFAKQLGAKRCVVGRELSFEEIKKISEEKSIETEIFLHGAQCYCYSGECLMSSMYGGRSGNKGKCAGPCRMEYKLKDGSGKVVDSGYILSPVDMCLGTVLDKVLVSGAKCLKIEGRMKGYEYVAACTDIYKNALEKEVNLSDEELTVLENTFSRGGFTAGLFEGRDNRIKKESSNDLAYANQEQKLLEKYKKIYDKNLRRTPVVLKFKASPGEKAELTADAFGGRFNVKSRNNVQKAAKSPLTRERIREQLEKVGDYPLYAEKVEVNIKEDIFMPISELNEMRRSALEKALSSTVIRRDYKKEKQIKPVPARVKARSIAASVVDISQAEGLLKYSEVSEIYIPAEKFVFGLDERLVPSFPAIIREKHIKKYLDLLVKFKKQGVKKIKVSEWGMLFEAKKSGFDIIAGEELNVFNSASAKVLREWGVNKVLLSPEMTLKQIENMGDYVPYEVTVYGRAALMKTANCPLKKQGVCGKNLADFKLVDRKNEEIPIICNCADCVAVFYNSTPLYFADKKDELPHNISGVHLSFTVEAPKQCEAELQNWLKGKDAEGKFTRGHFFRGVL